ncbi:uncharacterized protein AMSG_06793 [Thecamonas trahens ATCC 50062]|uniref:WLM domain-containing protein n=1 Tax=Thecamonas trahens ATCC 50062 TaxID=461836 RepID=A0A0L0DD88_THETB|nr:hypothetical protein AMSG_06793 [Thecamonas trahens ATCC 50062]KNC50312.1 hypothetical protein AMSG_06793 [Thecamonas trahens ATCC 50062]|eukprot:XP_013756859.1 hypothetical protein AMSG_06793 [Thecamonas trahens ATCC 50062]
MSHASSAGFGSGFGSGSGIGKVTVKDMQDKAALELLTRVVDDVRRIVDDHGWRVGMVGELTSSNRRLLGLNVNAGQKILIRLRNTLLGPLFPYDDVMETMLHELAHNDVGPHNTAFYALLDKLRGELASLKRNGYSRPFAGSGRTLGGTFLNWDAPRGPPVAAASAAAVRRAKLGRIMGSGVLGSASTARVGKKLTPRELRARAAEQRLRDQVWCASRGDLDEATAAAEVAVDAATVDTAAAAEADVETPDVICKCCTLVNEPQFLCCDACGSTRSGHSSTDPPPPPPSLLASSPPPSAPSTALPRRKRSLSTSAPQPSYTTASGSKRARSLTHSRNTSSFWTCPACTQINEVTGSAVCHVSLLTGFSKDISAVPKGWTANLVEFDSVINQSRVTVAPYSPDRCANWVL